MVHFVQMLPKRPTIAEDFERLAKLAAKAGFWIAILCHVVPPQYRAVCDTLATLCTGGN